MRPLSLTDLYLSVNVCKQTTPETLHEMHCYGFLHETHLIYVINLGSDVMASLPLLVKHMQNCHSNAKYKINGSITDWHKTGYA